MHLHKVPLSVCQSIFTDSSTELDNSLKNISVTHIRSQTDEQTRSPHNIFLYVMSLYASNQTAHVCTVQVRITLLPLFITPTL